MHGTEQAAHTQANLGCCMMWRRMLCAAAVCVATQGTPFTRGSTRRGVGFPVSPKQGRIRPPAFADGRWFCVRRVQRVTAHRPQQRLIHHHLHERLPYDPTRASVHAQWRVALCGGSWAVAAMEAEDVEMGWCGIRFVRASADEVSAGWCMARCVSGQTHVHNGIPGDQVRASENLRRGGGRHRQQRLPLLSASKPIPSPLGEA